MTPGTAAADMTLGPRVYFVPGTAAADLTLGPRADITPGAAAADITLGPRDLGWTLGLPQRTEEGHGHYHIQVEVPSRAGCFWRTLP